MEKINIFIIILFFSVHSVVMADTLPKRDYQMALDLLKLSEASYRPDRMKPFGNNTSGYWQWKRAGYMDSGLNWTLFERQRASGKIDRVLAFGGTEVRDRTHRRKIFDFRDWSNNLHQGIYIGSLEKSLPAQYSDALKVTKSFLIDVDKDPNVTLTITGHSLGGGLSQFVSHQAGLRAFVYNSAPLGIGTQRTNDPLFFRIGQKRSLATTNVVNIHLRGDAVHELPGWQLGRQYMIEPAPGSPGINTNYKFGPTRDFLKRHGLSILLTGLKYQYSTNEKRKIENFKIKSTKIPPDDDCVDDDVACPPFSNNYIFFQPPWPPPVPLYDWSGKGTKLAIPSDDDEYPPPHLPKIMESTTNKRGGITMKTDVVKDQPANINGLFE